MINTKNFLARLSKIGISSNKIKMNFELYLLLPIYLFFVKIFFLKQGNPLIDIGREYYFSTLVAGGKVLYRDIFNPYGPFSYLFNGLLIKIFSNSLNLFYFLGYFTSFLILVMVYILSRQYTGRLISIVNTVFVMTTCVFCHHVCNFAVPYSFAILYGLLFLLVSVFCLVKFIDNGNIKFLYIASFLVGLCFTCKYEFLAIYALFLIFLFKFRVPLNQKILNLLTTLSMPVLMLLILFIQGLTINDCFSFLAKYRSFLSAKSGLYFYKTQAGSFYDFNMLLLTIKEFFYKFSPLLILIILIYLLYIMLRNCSLFTKIFIYVSLLLLSIPSYYFLRNIILTPYLSCLPILVTIFSLYILLFYRGMFKKQYLVLFYFAIAFSLKSFFHLSQYIFGTFFIPLLFISFSIFINEILPGKINLINKSILQKSFFTIFLMASIITIFNNYLQANNYNSSFLNTNKGSITASKINTKSFKKLIEYLSKNAKKEETIWAIPEGQIINYLTDKKSDKYYDNLMPIILEANGEMKILNSIQKNPPTYIVFTSRKTGEFNYKGICKDYAINICNYINNNYQLFDLNLENFVLYKIKQKVL